MINVFLILVVFSYIQFHFQTEATDDKFAASQKTYQCGNVYITYPFYDGYSRPPYCGFPGFKLNCSDAKPEFTISNSQTYYLLSMDSDSHTVSVARDDLWTNLCPETLSNTSINSSLFNYTNADENVTLYYECSTEPSYKENTFFCPDFYTNRRYGFFTTTESKDMLMKFPSGECKGSVIVPIYQSASTSVTNSVSLLTAIHEGFELEWFADNDLCDECRKSGGECGYNMEQNKFACYCSNGSFGVKCKGSQIKKRHRKLSIVLIVCLSAAGICVLLILVLYEKRRFSSDCRGLVVFQRERKLDIEAFLKNNGSSGLKRYTYTHLKKITNSFKNKIGEGGYGSVYKGRLENGNLVAVKLLHKSKANAGDFINEVESVGNTNHVNVVKLFGFCYEGNRQALVYEFMANGSLEKSLFTSNNSGSLGLNTLFEIAIGVARGLEYLHRGCNTRILHFDIKPHNILLDENFRPKISDFGLAKSCPQKESIILSMSEARGTVGYIAPEVFLKNFGGVSYKSDVYSYGMLVLEMVGCRRRKATVEGEHSTEQYFPQWIYEQLEGGEEPNQEVVLSNEESEMQRRMIVVSLWCIQTNPSSRPAMSKVVEMLEGTLELQIPAPSNLSLSLFESLRSQHLNTLTDSLSSQVQNKTT